MNRWKKILSICMICFMFMSVLPINFLGNTAMAATAVAKYSKYSDIWIEDAAQYKTKNLVYINDYDSNNKIVLIENGKTKSTVLNVKDGYASDMYTKGNITYFTVEDYSGNCNYYQYNYDTAKLSKQGSNSTKVSAQYEEFISYPTSGFTYNTDILKSEKILEKINAEYNTSYKIEKNTNIEGIIYKLTIGSTVVNIFECYIEKSKVTNVYYGVYNSNVNYLTTSPIEFTVDESYNKIFIFEEDEVNENYIVYGVDNNSIDEIAKSDFVWEEINIVGNNLYASYYGDVVVYELQNSKYEEVNVYENVSISYGLDVNGAIWILKSENNKYYLYKIENNKYTKMYEISSTIASEMYKLYVYDQNNIIASTIDKATFIIPNGEGSLLDPISVTSVSLNKSELTIGKGSTETLKATVSPSNATNKNVTWTSSDTKVATVDSNGKVKGVATGTATITVKTKDGSKTKTCKVTVKNVFSKLEIKSVNKNSTKITGVGTKDAKVTAYVDGKSIGSATVAKDGTYSISISKQKAGKEITVKMTKSGYISKSEKTTVKNVFSKLEIKSVNKNSTKIKGVGTKDAKVTAYVDGKSIGSATVAKDGTYSISISKQKAGKEITVKMTKSGYSSKSEKVTVKNVFSTFTVNNIKKSSTSVSGSGTKGATVKVYVNDKEIGKATVGSDGKYKVKIAKQKSGTKVVVKMSKSGYSTASQTVTVK